MKTYTSVVQNGRDSIYHRYIDERGIRRTETVKYKPFLGVPSHQESKFRTIKDDALDVRMFESISEMRAWKKKNEGMFDFYGDINPVYQFIATQYPAALTPARNKMVIHNFDIEVDCERGFPDPMKAEWPISLIAIQDMATKKFIVFGYKNYENTRKDVEYVHCDDEADLLMRLVAYWKETVPDILTGWYIDGFDIPYIVHRIDKLLGQNWTKKLSPVFKIVKHNNTGQFGTEERVTYTIQGIQIWDYVELYKKFTFDPREQYTLDYIAKFEKVEDGEGKLKFNANGLHDLYVKDFQTYVDYCIKDVELVTGIDAKVCYIDLGLQISYMSKCLFKDVFGTVAMWDTYLYSAALGKRMLAPPKGNNRKAPFPGGWVEPPKRGMKRWTKVFDLKSSYPNSIRAYNMSPETIIDFHVAPKELQEISTKFGTIEKCIDIQALLDEAAPVLEKYNVCMTPNGHFFRNDIDGFIPEVVAHVYNTRVATQEKKKAKEKELEGLKGKEARKLKDEIAGLHAAQLALKVMMNSLYGAMSNEWFRYFDLRMASGITAAGQVSVRGSADYVEKNIKGMKNLYTDTDSIFLDYSVFVDQRFPNGEPEPKRVHDFCMSFTDKVVQPCINEYFEKLNKGLNLKAPTLEMCYEALAQSSLFLEKKKYVMHIVNDEGKEIWDTTKLKIRGIEIVRTSTPQFVRDKLKEVVLEIFKTMDEPEVHKYIKGIRTEFDVLPFEEVAFPRGVATFDKYVGATKSVPIAVRASFLYNSKLKIYGLTEKYREIHQGDKVKFAYIEQPNCFGSDVIGFIDEFPEEWDKDIRINRKVMWEKAFEAPLQKMFDALEWDLTNKTTSLESFFG